MNLSPFPLHFLILSPFPLHFLILSPFPRSPAARLQRFVQPCCPFLTREGIYWERIAVSAACFSVKWHEKGNTALEVLCPLICIFKSCWSGVWSEPASICACLSVLARRVSRVLWRVRCISKTSLWSPTLVLNPQQREKRTFAAQFHQWPTQCNYNFKTQDSTTKQ